MAIEIGGIRIDRVLEMEIPFRDPAEMFVEDTAARRAFLEANCGPARRPRDRR